MPKIAVLIAEDTEPIARLYQKMLPDTIFDITIAADGREALQKYKENKPDIIVLDIMMPFLSGYLVLQEIREKICDTKTPVVMATSKDDKEDVVACAKLGIQGYLVKPFKPMRVIRQLIEAYAETHPREAATFLSQLRDAE